MVDGWCEMGAVTFELPACMRACTFASRVLALTPAAASREPGSRETMDVAAPWEPGSGAPSACRGLGPGESPGNQSPRGRTQGARFRGDAGNQSHP